MDRTRRPAPAMGSVMATELINGNQAVARGALAAGLDFIAHYPGSPVNLVERELKSLAARHGIAVATNDAVNEHVAVLAAAGASFAGARSLVVMKHVGLNIAADPLNYVGYAGVRGGMLIVVGTDPGANSSTGEEDVHWYVPQFNFPLIEPKTIEEIYRFTAQSFELSERYGIPVLMFLPGRLCFNHAVLDLPPPSPRPARSFRFEKDRDRYINVGQRAVRNHRRLVETVDRIAVEQSITTRCFNPGAEVGIITRGMAFGDVYESVRRLGLEADVDLLNFELVYPANRQTVADFARGKREIVFIEDQDGFLEMHLKMQCFNELRCAVSGKDVFPRHGELRLRTIHDHLAAKFGRPSDVPAPARPPYEVPERLGTFCEGCPHTASYFAIDSVLAGRDAVIGGDIGCSSLPPFRADWLLCMNAGIGVSQGLCQVADGQVVISTGGEGSFYHGGLLSVLNAVHNDIDLIHVVFDNGTIAMTGHQETPGRGRVDPVALLRALGVDRVHEVSAYDPGAFIGALEAEVGRTGVRVFWVRGDCVRIASDYIESRRRRYAPGIDNALCNGCSKCYTELACPAIVNDARDGQHLRIDLEQCVRCGVCSRICPNGAITVHELNGSHT
jgi:indolepyruvate ferredoxin oxidoreductase, alpha subunit